MTRPLPAPGTPSPRPGRVLLVTYPFPPVGGAGVQRVTKFVKYLGRHGWEPTVLTVANPSVPLFDHSLDGDIPPGTVVRRARSLEPAYAVKASVGAGTGRGGLKARFGRAARGAGALVLQPDPQVLWLPNAVREGRRILAATPHDAVLASGPPFSTFLIAAALARHAGLPVALDYRDEWTISNAYWENRRLDPVSRFVQERMQDGVLRAAKAVIATTRASADALRDHGRRAGSRARVTWIYNGFDPDDFAHLAPADRDPTVFRLVYVGTLWNLTSAAPLSDAVKGLIRRHPDLAPRLELVFVGRRTGDQVGVVEGLRGLPCRVTVQDYVDHAAALGLMASADALLLLLSEVPGASRVVPAKLFEYLAARRPILALLPTGEAWGLLDGVPHAHRFRPAEAEAVAGWLAEAVRSHRAGPPADAGGGFDIRPYSRDYQAGQLAGVLNAIRRRPASPDSQS